MIDISKEADAFASWPTRERLRALKRIIPRARVEEVLARADRLYGEGKHADAARAYRDALSRAPANWPRYGRAVESLLFSLQMTHDQKGCAEEIQRAVSGRPLDQALLILAITCKSPSLADLRQRAETAFRSPLRFG